MMAQFEDKNKNKMRTTKAVEHNIISINMMLAEVCVGSGYV
jgi:hypothetical protein